MKSIVSASIMFDEASDITMNKKLNIFINVRRHAVTVHDIVIWDALLHTEYILLETPLL